MKEECLSKLVLLGAAALRRVLAEYVEHFPAERNHPGKGKVLWFPSSEPPATAAAGYAARSGWAAS